MSNPHRKHNINGNRNFIFFTRYVGANLVFALDLVFAPKEGDHKDRPYGTWKKYEIQ